MIEEIQKYVFDVLKSDPLFSQLPLFLANVDPAEGEDFSSTDKAIEDFVATQGVCVVVYCGEFSPNPEKSSASALDTKISVPVYFERNWNVAKNNPLALNIGKLTERALKLIGKASVAVDGKLPGMTVGRPGNVTSGFASAEQIPVEEIDHGVTCGAVSFIFRGRLDFVLPEVPAVAQS